MRSCCSGLDIYKAEVRSWLSDQAVEKEFGNAPATIIPAHWRRSPKATQHLQAALDFVGGFGQEYLFPFSIAVHDHLHIVFNPLEEFITASSLWQRFEALLIPPARQCDSYFR